VKDCLGKLPNQKLSNLNLQSRLEKRREGRVTWRNYEQNSESVGAGENKSGPITMKD